MKALTPAVQDVRSRICNVALIASSVIGVPALAASLYRASAIGWKPVMTAHVVVAIVLWIVTLLRHRTPYVMRAGTLVTLYSVVALGGLWQFGILGGVGFLVVAPALAMLLLGERIGIAVVVALLSGAGGIGIHTVLTRRPPPVDFNDYVLMPSAWMTNFFGWLMVTLALTALIGAFNRFFMAAIGDARRYEMELREHSSQLERLVEERTAELRNSEARLSHILEASPIAINLVTRDGRVVFANQMMADLLGGRRERLFDSPATDFYADPADREALFAELVRAGRARNREVLMRKANGTTFWALVSAEPAPFEADLYIGWIFDISALKAAREMAEEASRAKSRFLSSMSHELRTPLNAIIGFGQLLESDSRHPLQPRQLEAVGHILEGGNHLLDLINQVLDLAKIESGSMLLSIEAIDVDPAIADCLIMTNALAEEKAVTVRNDCVPGTVPAIRADFLRFKQVLLNLLTNAVKYNVDGGSVHLAFRIVDGDRCRFLVRDSGIGIPPDQQSVVFQPFTRLGNDSGVVEGTGIGLSIARDLVHMMNGTIAFESEPGRGSTFWFDLPLAEEPSRRGPERDERDLAARSDSIPPCTVLYVEDNSPNVQLMEMIFSRLPNARLVTAATAEAGIDMARATPPDMIVMDINLPGMNGIDAMRVLRGDARTRGIPVVAASASAMPEDIKAAMAASFDRYLTKPFNIADVVDIIVDTLAAAARPPATPAAAADGGPATAELDAAAVAILRRSARTFGASYVHTLESQFAVLRTQLGELRRAVGAGDAGAAGNAAHKLKTTGQSLGARDLSALAAEAEALARDGRLAGMVPLPDRLDAEFRRIEPAIRGLLAGLALRG